MRVVVERSGLGSTNATYKSAENKFQKLFTQIAKGFL